MTVHERMAKVTSALSHIPKRRSKGVSYEFRSIDDVMQALHGPLAEHGLTLSVRVLDDWQVNLIPGKDDRQQSQALFRVCVDVVASDGTTHTLGPGLAQSHDYGDKAVYQAQQNAVKYLLLTAFCIPTVEADMDGRDPDPVPNRNAVQSAPPETPAHVAPMLAIREALKAVYVACGKDSQHPDYRQAHSLLSKAGIPDARSDGGFAEADMDTLVGLVADLEAMAEAVPA